MQMRPYDRDIAGESACNDSAGAGWRILSNMPVATTAPHAGTDRVLRQPFGASVAGFCFAHDRDVGFEQSKRHRARIWYAVAVSPGKRGMPLEQSELELATTHAGPPVIEDTLDSSARDRLQRLAKTLALPLLAYDPASGTAIGGTEAGLLPLAPIDFVQLCARLRELRILTTPSGMTYVALPLSIPDRADLVAVGYALTATGARPTDCVVAAAGLGWPAAHLDGWLSRLSVCDPTLLKQLAKLAMTELERTDRQEADGDDYTRIATQLDYTYEELNLLHTLTQSMHISRSPREIAELSLERIDAVIRAGGHAIWLDDKREGRLFLIQGEIPVDEMGMARLIARFDGHSWPRPLVRNHVAGTLLGADFPRLRNFALVAVADGGLRFGWILSCNLADNADFGSVQTSLLSSVAAILGTHQHNLELYRQHEDLLLSFVRSLVSTLDAKDAYTRGHSERVALVARRIGAHLGLPEEDLRNIYLSGLLHDIGKIGVDDQVLRKPGQLTRKEFEQIKRHPEIGYNILAGLRNLHAVLPGVRHHHEAFSGNGYPDALIGEEIPLMARILAVADSYDAMISDRPYRGGLKLEKLEEILREGSGTQWDPRVVAAYFAIRDEISLICSKPASGQDPFSSGAFVELEKLADDRDPLRRIEGIRGALGTL